MFYIGLDVHTTHHQVCVLDERGHVHATRRCRSLTELKTWLNQLAPPFQITFEAGTDYGLLYDQLSPLAEEVQVAHPKQLAIIFRSRKKNDKNDAEQLARMLAVQSIPQVHVPSKEVRDWRQLINFRQQTVAKRTRAKNGLRALLRTHQLTAPGSLWSRSGREWLRGTTFGSVLTDLKRDQLLGEVQFFDQQIKQLEQELNQRGHLHPGVKRLMTIPGIGMRTAEALVAYIDDPHRFKNAKQVGAYFGLIPSQDQSGTTNRLGRITREGAAVVRNYLTEAAWQSIRHSPTVRAVYERIRRGDKERTKKALVATACYLARVAWSMLKHETDWQESVPLIPMAEKKTGLDESLLPPNPATKARVNRAFVGAVYQSPRAGASDNAE